MLRNMLFLYFLFSVSISNGSTNFVGFTPTNKFLLHNYRGEFAISCRSTGMIVDGICAGRFYDHDRVEYFYHPNKDANRFSLVSFRADGTKAEVSGKFVASKGQSEFKINLWSGQLQAPPLLRNGINRIEYKLFAGKEFLESGEFEVSIEASGASYVCPWELVVGERTSDCYYQEQACEVYMKQVFRKCTAK